MLTGVAPRLQVSDVEQHLISFIQAFSYPAVFVLLLACGLGAPISEDVIVVLGGAAIGSWGGGPWHLAGMIVTAYFGKLIGDVMIFTIGRRLGKRAINNHRLRHLLTPRRIELAERHFAKHGFLTVLFSRFLPGLRAPSFFVAGASGFRISLFILADGLAATVSAPLLVGLGYRFGAPILRELKIASHWIFAGIVVLALTAVLWVLLRRSRRQEASSPTGSDNLTNGAKRRLMN